MKKEAKSLSSKSQADTAVDLTEVKTSFKHLI